MMGGDMGPTESALPLGRQEASSSKTVSLEIPGNSDSNLPRLEVENPLEETMCGEPAQSFSVFNLKGSTGLGRSEGCNDGVQQMGSSSDVSSTSIDDDPGRTCQKPTGDLERVEDPWLLLLPSEELDDSEIDLSRCELLNINEEDTFSLSML